MNNPTIHTLQIPRRDQLAIEQAITDWCEQPVHAAMLTAVTMVTVMPASVTEKFKHLIDEKLASAKHASKVRREQAATLQHALSRAESSLFQLDDATIALIREVLDPKIKTAETREYLYGIRAALDIPAGELRQQALTTVKTNGKVW